MPGGGPVAFDYSYDPQAGSGTVTAVHELASSDTIYAAAFASDDQPGQPGRTYLLAADKLLVFRDLPAALPTLDLVRPEALPLADVREVHRRLAEALETRGVDEPIALAHHLRAAGETRKAGEYALEAAGRALEGFAFERAAQLYELGLALAPPADHGALTRLYIRLAWSSAAAGHASAGATAYLKAAHHAAPSEALVLQRRAAQHLLLSGHTD